jgi:phosphoserine phosphatase
MRQTLFFGTKIGIVLLAVLLHLLSSGAQAADPLPSWNDGGTKHSIVSFVSAAVNHASPGYVQPEDRVAVFDNDGTLWSEKPLYFQFRFALEEVRVMAPQHPEWRTQQPFAAVLEGDMRALEASGDKGLAEILVATHSGMTTEQFSRTIANWLSTARHPDCACPYTSLVYQPMLELLSYLRANGFKTYIVSGGTVEFMRVFAQAVYGVPPEQVIGTVFATRFRLASDGKPELLREPRVDVLDDGPGKPSNIDRIIGRRPVFAFGNSDGDQQMLEWTEAGSGVHLEGLVHHTDAAREYAYDRQSSVGRLDKALDEGVVKGWVIVDMRRDWRTVYPPGVIRVGPRSN